MFKKIFIITIVLAIAVAFIGGIFDRLLDVQGDLDWTDVRLAQDNSSCRVARIMRILDVCMLVSIACLLIVIWWRMA